jgi:hypothetical protein
VDCSPAFQPFRQALLAGANDGPWAAWQVSPDKSVIFRCASSPFTNPTDWERLRDVVVTRLVEPALYGVSVRSLAAWTKMGPGGDEQARRLRTHPQASSPRSVTLPQLPSSRTLPIGVDIWYTALLETPSLVQGTCTPQNHAHAGRTQSAAADAGLRPAWLNARVIRPCVHEALHGRTLPSTWTAIVTISRPVVPSHFISQLTERRKK